MLRIMCKSKLHRLTVTETNIDYQGSITLDKKLLLAADILPMEKVQVVNISNGSRFETYAIEGKDGVVCLNGAAARLATPKDLIIVLCYTLVEENEAKKLVPKIVHVDAKNKIN